MIIQVMGEESALLASVSLHRCARMLPVHCLIPCSAPYFLAQGWAAEARSLVTEASSASLASDAAIELDSPAAGLNPNPSPADPPPPGDAAALARELADVKKRFVVVAKRTQQVQPHGLLLQAVCEPVWLWLAI